MKKRKKRTGTTILMALTILLFTVFVGVLLMLSMMPSFSLTQDALTLEIGSQFSALDYIGPLKNASTGDISVQGEVNTKSPGTYIVTYQLGNQIQKLTVTVRDTVPPVISLKDGEYVITPGQVPDANSFADATDDTKLTLTLDAKGQDLTVPGSYPVVIRAVDSSGNQSEAEIVLTVKAPDTIPPTITGLTDVLLMVGDKFDPTNGVTVSDDTDSDPSLNIDQSGLDLSKPGTYSVTYTAVDAWGNKMESLRKVTVTKDYVPVMYTPEGGTYGWDARGIEGQPYLVCVNRAMCTITVYEKDADGNYTVPIKAIVCSVAREGHTTPLGRFTTADRHKWCYMVDGSYGRYAIRIRKVIMFHSVCYYSTNIDDLEYEEYNKLGSPASLGCIRMCVADEKWLYDNCPEGFPVVIYDDTSLDGPLGKPEPIHIDVTNTTLRGWDPTDWDPENPWNP